MDIKAFKQKLNKLNTVFNTISEDGDLSTLEKDLLKNYVMGLYEDLQGVSSEPMKAAPATIKQEPKPAIESKPPPEIKVEEPKIIEKSVPPPQPAPESKVVHKAPTKVSIPKDLKEIFEIPEQTELSDKLAFSKIDDIRKSMGINEKLFTIQELFGGDQQRFNDVLNKIEACKDYNEAKMLLSKSVAAEENWGEAGKIKKAKQFVKLIQRKFT